MTTTHKWTAAVLGAVVMLTSAGLSTMAADRPAGPAGPRPGAGRLGPPMDRPGREGLNPEMLLAPPEEMMRLGQELKLTDQQKEAIRTLAKAKMEAIRPLMEQIPPLHKQLADTMLSDAPDATAAKALVEQINGIKTQVAGIGIDFWTQVRSQLTPDQNAQLTQLLRQRIMRPRWPGMDRRGPGAGPNPGPGGQKPPPGAPPEPDPGL